MDSQNVRFTLNVSVNGVAVHRETHNRTLSGTVSGANVSLSSTGGASIRVNTTTQGGSISGPCSGSPSNPSFDGRLASRGDRSIHGNNGGVDRSVTRITDISYARSPFSQLSQRRRIIDDAGTSQTEAPITIRHSSLRNGPAPRDTQDVQGHRRADSNCEICRTEAANVPRPLSPPPPYQQPPRYVRRALSEDVDPVPPYTPSSPGK